MNSFLAVVCLISGVVTPGYAIRCTQCSSTLPICSGSTITCASKLVCMSLYEGSSLGSSEMFIFNRGCGEKQKCGKSGVFGLPSGKHRFSSNCCESDNCTPLTPVLPPVNYTYNGKSCPYCVSATSMNCESDEKMQCMGDENICAIENAEITDGSSTQKTSVRGCATNGYCVLGTQISEFGGVRTKLVVKCGASTALYSALMLLILTTTSLISNVD